MDQPFDFISYNEFNDIFVNKVGRSMDNKKSANFNGIGRSDSQLSQGNLFKEYEIFEELSFM